MMKFEAATLEDAMQHACDTFGCSITELQIEVVQHPKSGVMGLFKKHAIIVAIKNKIATQEEPQKAQATPPRADTRAKVAVRTPKVTKQEEKFTKQDERSFSSPERSFVSSATDIITPHSLVTPQDEYEDFYEEDEFKPTPNTAPKHQPTKEAIQKNIAKHAQEEALIKRIHTPRNEVETTFFHATLSMDEMIEEITHDINVLFSKACFNIEPITVTPYDDMTLLIEFTGDDAALLIGKEGYRYKALSYMLFNWINAKYGLQLRLEIAEFLKNQEEMVAKYLENVCVQVEMEGRAQTKILDGVLVQIALKKLRTTYPDKYVGIRTNRDGLKYIIINSFRTHNG